MSISLYSSLFFFLYYSINYKKRIMIQMHILQCDFIFYYFILFFVYLILRLWLTLFPICVLIHFFICLTFYFSIHTLVSFYSSSHSIILNTIECHYASNSLSKYNNNIVHCCRDRYLLVSMIYFIEDFKWLSLYLWLFWKDADYCWCVCCLKRFIIG